MSLNWVYDWIYDALPDYGADNIFRANQSNIIPSDPFITYQVISMDLSRFEAESDGDLYADPDVTPPVNGTFTRTYQQYCPLQLQIDCYSANGLADLQHLVSHARSESSIAIFDASYVAFNGAGQVRNLAYLADNTYVNRWQLTLDFTMTSTRIAALNAILDWEIGEEFETDGIDDPIESAIIV